MMDWITGLPFVVAAAILTGVAAVRSQTTYWLGRGIRAGVVRGAWAQRLASDKQRLVLDRLERWGWPLIPVSFLTLGFQTAVQLTAGLIGWRWPRYTLAAIPGWIAWGCVYAAGGLAAFAGLVVLVRQSWWVVALVVAGVAGAVVVVVRRRRQARPAVAPVGVAAA